MTDCLTAAPSPTCSAAAIRRQPVDDRAAAAARQRITEHVTQLLQDRLDAAIELGSALDAMSEPTAQGVREDTGMALRVRQLRTAQLRDGARAPSGPQRRAVETRASSIPLAEIGPSTTIITGPYDVHWAIPNDSTQYVNATTDTDTAMTVFSHGSNDSVSGFGAAGFGIFLTSPSSRVVSIRPFAPCSFGYDFWSLAYSSNSRGGFGTLVYDGLGNIVPGTLQQPEVWDRTAMNDAHTHVDGSDYLQNHLNNGELAFTMNGGETYQLWIWIWAHADQSGIQFTDIFGNDWGSGADLQFSATIPWVVIS